jgi:2,3-dihydroxybenzoate-AMP ligase
MFERLIRDIAARDRTAIAIATPFDSISFVQMEADIRRCAARLRPLALRPGSRAVLQVSDLYTHWLLTFALEAMGVTTVGLYYRHPLDDQIVAFLGADFVFADHPLAPGVAVRSQVVGRDWMHITRGRFRPLPLPARERKGDDPVRIVLSSGTTGTPKKVLLTRDMIDRRGRGALESDLLERAVARSGAPGSLALISEVDPSTIGGLMMAIAIWSMGGRMCQRAVNLDWAETLTRLQVTALVAAPVQIQGLLDELPPDFTPPKRLTLGVIGGSLSKPLAALVKQRLTTDIFIFYGTTESGSITEGHLDDLKGAEDSAGRVGRSSEVELILPDGRRAAPGELGEVRVRGPNVVDGYLDSPEETARYFRDGWYHPGDLAIMDEDGTLRVAGRTDDLMNIGGVKFLPSEIETRMLGCEGVCDVAAFSVRNEQGLDRLYAVYVADEALDPETVRAAVAAGDPNLLVSVKAARVPSIPRNALGKIERARLRADVASGAL